MSNNNYEYKNPIDQGYKQFHLTKSQHNKLFEHRQIKWHDKYEYYYNDKEIIMHNYNNWKSITLYTLAFPILLIYHGLSNIKETISDYKELFNQKKYGSFVSDSVYKDKNKECLYEEIMKVIKGE